MTNDIKKILFIYESINSVKEDFRSKVLNETSTSSNSLFGGKKVSIPRAGAHAGQKGWQSNNAWDIPTPIGTPVYSVTSGVVQTFSDYGPIPKRTHGKTLFGAGFTVKSDSGPNVYYTHLKNCQVKRGDKISCGQLLGFVMDFPGSSYDHLHIAVSTGHDISEVIDNNGNIKCGKGLKILGKDIEIPKDLNNTDDLLNTDYKGKKVKDILNISDTDTEAPDFFDIIKKLLSVIS